MKVFKFGGASVKDAAGVKNLHQVVTKVSDKDCVIVVSAMGKITNALEKVVYYYLNRNENINELVEEIKSYHQHILTSLFLSNEHKVFRVISNLFEDLKTTLYRNKSRKYDYVYDQIVSYGELISTKIISMYLEDQGFENTWIDARNMIKTNNTYRDAQVDWVQTQKSISNTIDKKGITVTQGFIGSDENNFTTTLGREGSDYSAGIFAYCMDADSVTIWKDVPGVLNADPKIFDNTQLLSHISYEEAIELAFFGASIIHPKTIQPLQRKEIPLFVKSFVDPMQEGTSVNKGQPLEPNIPCYIVKKDQILLSLSSLDFSFIVEENISAIFSLFHKYQIKVGLIQNSAISFSICLDDKFEHFDELLLELKAKFRVQFYKNVSLFTIRHFNNESIRYIEHNKHMLLKQISRETYQMVAKN